MKSKVRVVMNMAKKYTEEQIKEALEIYKREHEDSDHISRTAEVILKDGTKVKIGKWGGNVKNGLTTISPELKKLTLSLYPKQFEKNRQVYTEEQIKEALKIYKRKHEDSNYIPQKAIVILENGTKVNVGIWGASVKSGNTQISPELEKLTLSLYPKQFENNSKVYTEEQIKEALEIYKREHEDSDRIPIKAVVILKDGTKMNIGTWGSRMKQGSVKVSPELEKLTLSLYPKQFEKNRQVYTEEQIKEALEIHKREHEDSDRIPIKAVVILKDGTKVNIGIWGRNMKTGKTPISSELRELVLKLYPNQFKVIKKSKTGKASTSTLEKYKNIFDGDEEKANRVVECLKDLREKRQSRKKQEWNMDNLLQEFDVNVKQLNSYLNRTKSEERKAPSEPLKYHGETLRSYCIERGYNYDVIARAVRLHEFCPHDTLEQLINRVVTTYHQEGQQAPSTWIYEKYGNLVKHELTYLHLDSNAILRNMSQNVISLEEAIRHDVFLKERKERTNDWLEEPYNYLVEEIDSEKGKEETEQDLIIRFYSLVKEYHLEQSEYQILWNSISRYINTMREYQKLDVGLTTKEEEKIEKIKKYRMEEQDIEESFFIPLSFDKGVLVGRQSELYKRRDELKKHIMGWDNYTEEEKEALKSKFNPEELHYINKTRKDINKAIRSVKK